MQYGRNRKKNEKERKKMNDSVPAATNQRTNETKKNQISAQLVCMNK